MSQESRTQGRPAFNQTHALSHEGRVRAAERILLPLLTILKPGSMLDVGCGLGAWLQVAERHGISDCLGLDGSWIEQAQLRIERKRFRAVDLERPFDLKRRFDLVVSLEVAEHLPGECAGPFIDSLCAHGDVVLFSAAVPGQGGNGHVNEQLQHVWAESFRARGYAAVDIVRPSVWLDPGIFWWLQQNTVLYVRANRLQEWPALAPYVVSRLEGLSVIHPRLYLNWVAECQRLCAQGTADGG